MRRRRTCQAASGTIPRAVSAIESDAGSGTTLNDSVIPETWNWKSGPLVPLFDPMLGTRVVLVTRLVNNTDGGTTSKKDCSFEALIEVESKGWPPGGWKKCESDEFTARLIEAAPAPLSAVAVGLGGYGEEV